MNMVLLTGEPTSALMFFEEVQPKNKPFKWQKPQTVTYFPYQNAVNGLIYWLLPHPSL